MTFAYLDPGTGSLLLQALFGGIAGIAVYMKAKGRRLFRRREHADAPERTDA